MSQDYPRPESFTEKTEWYNFPPIVNLDKEYGGKLSVALAITTPSTWKSKILFSIEQMDSNGKFDFENKSFITLKIQDIPYIVQQIQNLYSQKRPSSVSFDFESSENDGGDSTFRSLTFGTTEMKLSQDYPEIEKLGLRYFFASIYEKTGKKETEKFLYFPFPDWKKDTIRLTDSAEKMTKCLVFDKNVFFLIDLLKQSSKFFIKRSTFDNPKLVESSSPRGGIKKPYIPNNNFGKPFGGNLPPTQTQQTVSQPPMQQKKPAIPVTPPPEQPLPLKNGTSKKKKTSFDDED